MQKVISLALILVLASAVDHLAFDGHWTEVVIWKAKIILSE